MSFKKYCNNLRELYQLQQHVGNEIWYFSVDAVYYLKRLERLKLEEKSRHIIKVAKAFLSKQPNKQNIVIKQSLHCYEKFNKMLDNSNYPEQYILLFDTSYGEMEVWVYLESTNESIQSAVQYVINQITADENIDYKCYLEKGTSFLIRKYYAAEGYLLNIEKGNKQNTTAITLRHPIVGRKNIVISNDEFCHILNEIKKQQKE